MRVEFRIWHEGKGENSECFYAMFDPERPSQPVRIDHFPIAAETIARLMPELLAELNDNSLLSRKLFQAEFLSSTTGDIVVTLIYHRQLDSQWETCAKKLEDIFGIAVIGRARKQKIVLSRDFVTEKLEVLGREYSYQQKENSFTQPNAAINREMIEWCCQYLQDSSRNCKRHSLLEMYCGNGNFTLPLSRHFKQVLATEIAKTSIASARHNAAINGIDNTCFVRLSGEETAQALAGTRPFRRLADVNLDSYKFSTVFVDPPRAGLDRPSLDFIGQFDEIIYISCNPAALAENITSLGPGFAIKRFAIFDQFPYTSHTECGVILEKRGC